MEKEFEALENLSKQEIIVKKGIGVYMDGSVQTMPHKTTVGVEFKGHIETLKQALTELQAIKEAKPSEALECLKDIKELFDKIAKENPTTYKTETFAEACLFQTNTFKIELELQKAQVLEWENELLKQIIKSFFVKGSPLHQYVDKDFGLTIEVDSDCSIMHLGEFKGVDLDKKLKEVLE